MTAAVKRSITVLESTSVTHPASDAQTTPYITIISQVSLLLL